MAVKIELNKVDQHIKDVLLTYPTLYNSRFSVLNSIFMRMGNGYEWNARGELTCDSNKPLMQKMDFSDIEESKQIIDQDLALNRQGKIGRSHASSAARLMRKIVERRLIEAQIDLYAVEHVMQEDQQFGVEWLKNFNPKWCLLRDAPFGSIDPDWAAAAKEFASIARVAIFRHLCMYHEDFDRANADEKWLDVFDQLEVIIDKLNLNTETKKREAEILELHQELVDGL